MALGSLTTNKTWPVLTQEVLDELSKWGITDCILPSFRQAEEAGKVAIKIDPDGQGYQILECHRFTGEHNAQRRNLCALREAIRSARLADMRGILGVLKSATNLKALQVGQTRQSGQSGEDEIQALAVLGITVAANQGLRRSAYREGIKQHHPDAGGERQAYEAVMHAGHLLGLDA